MDRLINNIRKHYLITHDIEAAAQTHHTLLGDSVRTFEAALTDGVSGEPFAVKLGFINLPSTQVVLVQPVRGENLFARLLAARGEGVHILGGESPHKVKSDAVSHFARTGWRHAMSVDLGNEELNYFTHAAAPFALEISIQK
jgi:hypothetical protein